MAHNYIVTAQKPTAVNACVTGNEIVSICSHYRRISKVWLKNCFEIFLW